MIWYLLLKVNAFGSEVAPLCDEGSLIVRFFNKSPLNGYFDWWNSMNPLSQRTIEGMWLVAENEQGFY